MKNITPEHAGIDTSTRDALNAHAAAMTVPTSRSALIRAIFRRVAAMTSDELRDWLDERQGGPQAKRAEPSQ